MKKPFLRVGKVGGSLFSFADLPTALRSWLNPQPGISVLIAGAGPIADFIRSADEQYVLGEATSHQLCLGAMRLSSEVLAALLPESPVAHDLASVQELVDQGESTVIVFNVEPFLSKDEPRHEMPSTWEATSDSIAAHVAELLGADELVLFKSCDLPPHATREQAGAEGLIDAHFSTGASRLKAVRWVNLRSATVRERLF
jgi:aspartokinase-like uncharacterized kinase